VRNSTELNQTVTYFARLCEWLRHHSTLRSGNFIHIWCGNMLSLIQKRRIRVSERMGENNAKRTARAEAPSGRNRQRSTHCPHCDRRNARDNIEATSEAQQRLGGGKSACREHHARGPQGDSPKGSSGSVGLMKKPKGQKIKAGANPRSIIARVRRMEAPEPIRPCKGRFIDYIIDMYDAPDQVTLRRVYSGAAGSRQDAVNIRSYFNAARRSIHSEG